MLALITFIDRSMLGGRNAHMSALGINVTLIISPP